MADEAKAAGDDSQEPPQGGELSELLHGLRPLSSAFIGVLFGFSTLFVYSYGVLMPFLEAEFGWSRLQLSLAPMLVGIISMMAAPIVGRLVDLFGARYVAVPSFALVGMLLLLMGQFAGGLGLFLAAIVVLAIAAAGTSVVTFVSIVGKQFDRARGAAIGITMAATGLAGALVTKFSLEAAEADGWRAFYVWLGVVLLLVAPLQFVLMSGSHRKVRQPAASLASNTGESSGWTLHQAVRHHVFWKMVVAIVLMGLATTGLIPHFVQILLSLDLSIEEAAARAASIGIAIVVGRLAAGALLDHVHAPTIGGIFALVAAVAVGGLALGFGELALLWAIMLGFALGAEIDVAGYVVARYYGKLSYGSVYGWVYSSYGFGSMVSPVFIGALYDLTGAYTAGLFVSVAFLLLTLPLFFTMGPYPTDKILNARDG